VPKDVKTGERGSKRRFVAIGGLCAGLIVIAAFVLAWGPVKKHFEDTTPKITQTVIPEMPDPLCQTMEKNHYSCVDSPAGEGLMGPGRYVQVSDLSKPGSRVPVGDGDLFAPVCIVDGVNQRL
jgi:hypothetical protein